MYLLVQAYQHLWLVAVNDLYQEFSSLSLATETWPYAALMLATRTPSHERVPHRSGRYFVRDALNNELPQLL